LMRVYLVLDNMYVLEFTQDMAKLIDSTALNVLNTTRRMLLL
jgi:hypothetical protein